MRRICQKARPSTSRNFSKTSTPRSRDIHKYQRISRQTQNQNDPAANEGRQRTVPESREDESRNAKHAAAHRHMGNIRSTQKHMGTLAQSSILNRTIEQKNTTTNELLSTENILTFFTQSISTVAPMSMPSTARHMQGRTGRVLVLVYHNIHTATPGPETSSLQHIIYLDRQEPGKNKHN